MEKNGRRLEHNLGMFDLFKGMGMLLVILGHTASLYDLKGIEMHQGYLLVIQLFFQIFLVGLMPAFFLVSGYGFRKRSLKKCIKQQAAMILRPYGYVAVATVISHLFIHYLSFGCWRSAVKESIKIAVGFLLALPGSTELFGTVFFSCGAIWYLAALFFAWIFLTWIMEKLPERRVPAGVAGAVLLGWLIGRNRVVPFCLSQALIAVGGLYAGYQMKKKRWFTRPLNLLWLTGGFGAVLLSLVITIYSDKIDNMADGVWALGPFSIVLDFFLGLMLLELFLELGRCRNGVFRMIERIGRYSLWIFCVHTVEMLALPWYLFAAHWEEHPVAGFLLQFVLRSMIIFLVCVVIRNKKVFVRGNRKRRKKE